MVRTGAIAVEGARVMIPGEVLARYLPTDLQGVRSSECVFPLLHPPSRYVAIRASESTTADESETGEDLVIVEVTGPSMPTVGMAVARDGEQGAQQPRVADVGIARALVRRRGEG